MHDMFSWNTRTKFAGSMKGRKDRSALCNWFVGKMNSTFELPDKMINLSPKTLVIETSSWHKLIPKEEDNLGSRSDVIAVHISVEIATTVAEQPQICC